MEIRQDNPTASPVKKSRLQIFPAFERSDQRQTSRPRIHAAAVQRSSQPVKRIPLGIRINASPVSARSAVRIYDFFISGQISPLSSLSCSQRS